MLQIRCKTTNLKKHQSVVLCRETPWTPTNPIGCRHHPAKCAPAQAAHFARTKKEREDREGGGGAKTPVPPLLSGTLWYCISSAKKAIRVYNDKRSHCNTPAVAAAGASAAAAAAAAGAAGASVSAAAAAAPAGCVAAGCAAGPG